MNRFELRIVGTLIVYLTCALAVAAQSENPQGNTQVQALNVRSNLVLVPALVKTKAGEVVLSLTGDDFVLTDDGVARPLQLETDTDSLPLALAIIVQNGGQGALHLQDYRRLGPVMDAVIGEVPHRIAVVSFDSKPELVRDFTSNSDEAVEAIRTLREGDTGAAILDALKFGIHLLQEQPPEYRHAVILFSETIDRSSEASVEDAVRAVNETNTSIYSFAFSSTKTAVKHEASKLAGAGTYSDEPYPAGGCMSHDPNADPDAHGKRSAQALDCASNLLPPLRLARMAFLAAKDGMKRNVPESVAQLTGGEYFGFKDGATLTKDLITISSDVPNYYVLSFRPQAPHEGLHSLEVKLKEKQGLRLTARKAYWVDSVSGGKKN
jgi:VWFA-related protein